MDVWKHLEKPGKKPTKDDTLTFRQEVLDVPEIVPPIFNEEQNLKARAASAEGNWKP